MKTAAAILVEQRKPLVIDEVEIPPLGYGQFLAQIHTSRICGSQLGEIDGVKGPDKYLPHLLGHEGGATVMEVGPEVKHVKPGDRVVLHWRPGRGIEARPPIYKWNGKNVNAGGPQRNENVVSSSRLRRGFRRRDNWRDAVFRHRDAHIPFGITPRPVKRGHCKNASIVSSV